MPGFTLRHSQLPTLIELKPALGQVPSELQASESKRSANFVVLIAASASAWVGVGIAIHVTSAVKSLAKEFTAEVWVIFMQ